MLDKNLIKPSLYMQGFLTAVKQEVNRRHTADKWALDDVVLTSEVTYPAILDPDSIKEAPTEGVFVYGLYLDGCAWSAKGNRLIDAEPKKLFNALPVLYVTGVQVRFPWHCNICIHTYKILDMNSFMEH
jgi:dynein heavy chain